MLKGFKKIEVETYAGYKYPERPESFIFNGKIIKIKEILKSSYELNIENNIYFNAFKVKSFEGDIYYVYYKLNSKEWYLGFEN